MTTLYGQWEVYPGNIQTSLALPDYFSTYLSYTIDTAKLPAGNGLRITGDFPFARYMSFNFYATRVGSSLGALTDFQITADSPNINPFVAGNDPLPPDRQYVVNVQQKQDGEETTTIENLLTYVPSDLLNPKAPNERPLLTIIIRYYVPEDGNYGKVGAPVVEFYDIANPTVCSTAPKSEPTDMDANEPIFRHRLSPIFDSVVPDGENLRFYHSVGGGQFNNVDNIYLISAVKEVDGLGWVVIMKVKPPTFPLVNERYDKTIVRYWSINQGNPNTSTPLGMMDSDFRLATDGFVYLVMGNKEYEDFALAGGYNFMEWKADPLRAVILYRNMLTIPQYRGSIARVPLLPQAPWEESTLVADEASQTIGEYAPWGKRVSKDYFLNRYGGMPSPGFVKL